MPLCQNQPSSVQRNVSQSQTPIQGCYFYSQNDILPSSGWCMGALEPCSQPSTISWNHLMLYHLTYSQLHSAITSMPKLKTSTRHWLLQMTQTQTHDVWTMCRCAVKEGAQHVPCGRSVFRMRVEEVWWSNYSLLVWKSRIQLQRRGIDAEATEFGNQSGGDDSVECWSQWRAGVTIVEVGEGGVKRHRDSIFCTPDSSGVTIRTSSLPHFNPNQCHTHIGGREC